jgi:hypothetical protein
VLNRETAGLQAAIGNQACVQNEEKRRQNEIGERDGGEEKQHLGWIAHYHSVHKYPPARPRLL